MLVQRPYLLRAFYNWIVDSECTPHVIVDATQAHVEVPAQFVENGKIVLNIAPQSVLGFSLDDDALSFNARFSGQPMQVYVPIYAIEGIYARENGEGTIFPPEAAYEALNTPQIPKEASPVSVVEDKQDVKKENKGERKRPTLTVVK
ncbi:ClpXP protease specificity-enhancing factor [Psychromonas algarum]|uniref:ClpXP protease specificity-enhancing factor n=1 Tax=Psychromonas algarum TaxID=2555643 RepID=UPI001ABBC9E9|nr:ClpXP protease specificity-enhancing factor [Psychromonas sp. RZ22]